MKVVIVCGGQGSRIRDTSDVVPKPMLPIGEQPILWHIMKGYASYGFGDFVLCLGYKGWLIKEFFLNYQAMMTDCSIDLGRPSDIQWHNRVEEAQWRVTLANTGEHAMTGCRLWRVRRYLEADDHFCLTYGDGLADVNLDALVDHHKRSGLIATLTGVRVGGRFGELAMESNRVTAFTEKPIECAGRINGGFMIFDAKRVWDYLGDREDLILEREPLERLAADGQLGVFEHDGFWQCMDTPREYAALNDMWRLNQAPWKTWSDGRLGQSKDQERYGPLKMIQSAAG